MNLPDILDVLPHRGMMRLIDRLLEEDGDCLRAETTPRSNAWYADSNGNMPGWLGIELMAQTIAAHSGMASRRLGTPPKIGFLLGTRRYLSSVSHFLPEQPLLIEACMSFREANGLGAYTCRIVCNGEELASATIKAFEPPDMRLFLKESQDD